MSETKEVTREEVLGNLRSAASYLRNFPTEWTAILAAIAYLEARPEGSEKRKSIEAAAKHAFLWREVCTLAKPHQRKGERVLATLRRLL